MADWSDWIDLELDDDDALDAPTPISMDRPSHPPGMRICLCGPELEKAGLPMPERGDMLHMQVFGEVTSVSDSEFGRRVEIQLKMMKVENEDTEA